MTEHGLQGGTRIQAADRKSPALIPHKDRLTTCLFPEKMVSAESMAATVRASGRQFSSVAAIRVRATLGSTGKAAMRRPMSVICPSMSMAPRMYSCLSASSRAGLCMKALRGMCSDVQPDPESKIFMSQADEATLGSMCSVAMRRPMSVMCPSILMVPRMCSCLRASSKAGFCMKCLHACDVVGEILRRHSHRCGTLLIRLAHLHPLYVERWSLHIRH